MTESPPKIRWQSACNRFDFDFDFKKNYGDTKLNSAIFGGDSPPLLKSDKSEFVRSRLYG